MEFKELQQTVREYLKEAGIREGTKTAFKIEHAICYGARKTLSLPVIVNVCHAAGRSILTLNPK